MRLKKIKRALKPFITKLVASLLPRKILLDKESFEILESYGYHVTPVHYYYPIPDTRELDEEILNRRTELKGIDVNEKIQLGLLSYFKENYKDEYDRIPKEETGVPYEYYLNNGAFAGVDGEILYCMIRHFKPCKVFEIGSGYSTCLSARAILENKKSGVNTELHAFEPYPNFILKKGFQGLSYLHEIKLQDLPLSAFDDLKEKDILFIDSSHVLKIGSDVQYEYLEILPRLNKGVIVHLHDIFLPAEYPRKWLKEDHLFWNEQYLLQAFLQFNDTFEIIWAGSYMHLKYPDRLRAAFNSYNPETVRPGSLRMRKVR